MAVSRDLPNVDRFLAAVESIRLNAQTLVEFDRQLDLRVNEDLRTNARNELRQLFHEMKPALALPEVHVYLPKRKKVAIRGLAKSSGCVPTEIRVYPITGVSGVSYENWKPENLEICSKIVVFEIFRHEVAHVLATYKHSRDCDHDELFVEAYDEVSLWMRANGFSHFLSMELELSGIPYNSAAAREAAFRGAGWTKTTAKSTATGCLTLLGAALFGLCYLLIFFI